MHALSDWLFGLFAPQSVGLSALVISIVAATGLALGAIKVRGFSLGIPGVMFTGLVISKLLNMLHPHALNEPMMLFVRDFGLILFVYAVGVQVGPGFVASLRQRGLSLNLMAAAIVLLGAVLAVGMAFVIPGYLTPGNPTPRAAVTAAVGLFAGGTTNAPALGSASEALKLMYPATAPGAGGVGVAAEVTTPAFAIAYPFGLVGVILAMVLLRAMFKVEPQAEAEALEAAEQSSKPELHTLNVVLRNPNLNGVMLKDIPAIEKTNVVVSRVLKKGRGGR